MTAGRVLAALAVLVVLVAAVFLVRQLGGVAPLGANKDVPIEQNWNKTILSLGVYPVFPPEEDLVVGDVLAIVTRETDRDSHEQSSDAVTSQLITRSVKLAHVDEVGPALDTAYMSLPVFPGASTLTPPQLRDIVARKFSDAVLLGNLPRAAFPRLKIQGFSSAAAGAAANGTASASFGAGSEQVEQFELSDVRTYGLPSVKALELFDAYCVSKPDICTEATARKHLQRVIGNRINERFVDDKSGEYRSAVEVEVVMVYRAYLTSSIVDLRRAERNQKGGLMAWWPFGSSQSPAAVIVPAQDYAPAAPAVPNGDPAVQIQALNAKLGDIERRLAAVKTGGALSYDSFSGNEASLEGKFERPVAIGYRSVKHDFALDKSPQPTK